MEKPWSQEYVDILNANQNNTRFHPYTCGGGNKGINPKCERQQVPIDWSKEGKLIATKDGWICPCGEYKQNWAHDNT